MPPYRPTRWCSKASKAPMPSSSVRAFTSVLPHFLVEGIVPAIARNVHARRIFIGNMLQCRETRGLDVGAYAGDHTRSGGGRRVRMHAPSPCLANHQLLPFEKTVAALPISATTGVGGGGWAMASAGHR